MKNFSILIVFAMFAACSHFAIAQHEHHAHGEKIDSTEKQVEAPNVFLDKSPRIVAYQLKRLDNERLLLVERKEDDAKYAPVYSAILSRGGMSPQYRNEALAGLVAINKSDAVTELLSVLSKIDGDDRQQQRTGNQLGSMLLQRPKSELAKHEEALKSAVESDNAFLRPVALAALIASGQSNSAWDAASRVDVGKVDWLNAVSLVPSQETRAELRDKIIDQLSEENSVPVRTAAIAALAFVPNEQADTFDRVAPLFTDEKLRLTVVKTLLRIPADARSKLSCNELIDRIVRQAEATSAEKRTTDEFIDMMQLADQLFVKLPVDKGREYRSRLREITVRVVRIHTVEEEMRYDVPYFAVEAGRPVQIVLQNEDLMAHNLVITAPDALQEVAELGVVAGPNGGADGKQYVPKSEKVLFATSMVQPAKQERLTFTAPKEPGEYPYVCTFPQHWMRMYGVMIVVPDLDAWLQNPIEPKDPVGSNRSFVQSWTIEDFRDDLEQGMKGRTEEIGERLFTEATCLLCHKVREQGGAVGPDLNDVIKRWKGDRLAVLQEILDPSHKIDPKYAVNVIETLDGKTVSGIISAEDKKTVAILENPEAKEPTIIKRDDIEDMYKATQSMMPKALLDRFTKDEILEIMAFLNGLSIDE